MSQYRPFPQFQPRPAQDEQQAQDEAVDERRQDIRLDQPQVVENDQDRNGINQGMEPAPVVSQPLRHFVRGRHRQRDEQDKSGETDSDIRPLRHVQDDLVPVEELVQHQVGGEVQAGVKKRKQAQHPAEPDQRVLAGDLPQRRDRQGNEQEAQRPFTGEMGNFLDRVGGQVIGKTVIHQHAERQRAEQEQDRLRPA